MRSAQQIIVILVMGPIIRNMPTAALVIRVQGAAWHAHLIVLSATLRPHCDCCSCCPLHCRSLWVSAAAGCAVLASGAISGKENEVTLLGDLSAFVAAGAVVAHWEAGKYLRTYQ